MRLHHIISLLLMTSMLVMSCQQEPPAPNSSSLTYNDISLDLTTPPHERKDYGFGGWYCPDNLRGFPPVDIQRVEEIEVITHRLPTEEEARDGRSLMFIDSTKYPNARAFDLQLPRLAWTYSRQDDGKDLAIIIQAAIIGSDTLVGYRYPSGGNGSGWLDELTFLSDQEIKDLGSTPYIMIDTVIAADRNTVWSGITKTDYAAQLGELFGEEETFATSWKDGNWRDLKDEATEGNTVGTLADMFGAIYLDIDYKSKGPLNTEKVLLLPEKGNHTRIQVVAGPYPADQAIQQERWSDWAQQVRTISEL